MEVKPIRIPLILHSKRHSFLATKRNNRCVRSLVLSTWHMYALVANGNFKSFSANILCGHLSCRFLYFLCAPVYLSARLLKTTKIKFIRLLSNCSATHAPFTPLDANSLPRLYCHCHLRPPLFSHHLCHTQSRIARWLMAPTNFYSALQLHFLIHRPRRSHPIVVRMFNHRAHIQTARRAYSPPQNTVETSSAITTILFLCLYSLLNIFSRRLDKWIHFLVFRRPAQHLRRYVILCNRFPVSSARVYFSRHPDASSISWRFTNLRYIRLPGVSSQTLCLAYFHCSLRGTRMTS